MNYSEKIEELNKLKMQIEASKDLDKTIELYSESIKIYKELKDQLDEIESKFEELSQINE